VRLSTTPPRAVFLLAFAVRLLVLGQIAGVPWFGVPLVDGANYVRLAEAIAGGDLLAGRQVFWQAPLYPYFLALLMTLFGDRMTLVLIAQAAVGSLSCVFVFFIGRRLFGERAGLAAGAVMALYGPLVLFDLQPLIPVLHIVLVLAGLLALLASRGVAGDGGAGLLWGLAGIATPNILLAAPAAAGWLAVRRRRAAPVAAFLAGLALPVLAVAARNLAVAGEPVLIASNGGINFYIGNNPDYERTIRIRPGGEFERLAQEPENLGIATARGRSRWFAVRAWRFVTEYPGQALRLYARKTLDLVAGREIPRNQDMYVYRGHSWLVAALLWRLGIAFPFGVVAPLALAGLLARGGEPGGPGGGAGDGAHAGRRLILLYAASYAVSILLFFPTDRYRLPLVPVLALFAGRLLAAPGAALRRPAAAAALAAGLVLFNLDASQFRETYPEEEALNRAQAFREKGKSAEAADEYRRAIALNPARLDPHNALAAMAAQEGRLEDAARHYRDLLERAPDFVEVRRNLGLTLQALGREEEARAEWQLAIRLAPGAGLALSDLCLSYLGEGLLLAAEPYCERAVRARPDLGETHLAMGLMARALRQRERARAELEAAVRLLPKNSPGRRKAAEILERMRRRDAEGSGPPGVGGPPGDGSAPGTGAPGVSGPS
jgi:tetratricopeptide (TPR) repeat protein